MKNYIGGVKLDQNIKTYPKRCYCGKEFTCHQECNADPSHNRLEVSGCSCGDCIRSPTFYNENESNLWCKSRFPNGRPK